jgi:PhzF family phenazine biosynthesis protein
MTPLLFTVDAFTNKPFSGNPAAVCVTHKRLPTRWMQTLAHELGLSETAFVQMGSSEIALRWFTPEVEVDLCGHATLASAFVLWTNTLHSTEHPLRFATRSGPLTCTWRDGWVDMDFPALPCGPTDCAAQLAQILGTEPVGAGFNGTDLLAEIAGEDALRRLTPDLNALRELPARGLIVTSRSASAEYDFVSRFFAPRAGIAEDPVTGSAHCALAPYWAKKLRKKRFRAFQASRRGGVVVAELRGADRVLLSGQAVTISRMELSAEAMPDGPRKARP